MSSFQITNSTQNDLSKIFELYRIATDYMKSKDQVSWPEFEKELIINEIDNLKQWKIVIDGEIACIWATALSDDMIWGANQEPSIYLHRIATNPKFRGQNLVGQIVSWADQFCVSNNLKYVRMDTVGLNQGLIKHYEKLGFAFLGTKELKDTSELPDHYNDGAVCLFQREVKK